MTDLDSAKREQLRLKVEEMRQKALQEEIDRIQKEVEPQAVESARRRIAEEDQARQNELQAALSERHVAEESLRMRELDTIERLKTLRRKYEELTKQQEEEDRIRAEAKRRIEEETKAKEEEEKKKREEKQQRVQTMYQRASDYFDKKEYAKALEELDTLLAQDAAHKGALELQAKIREVQEIEKKKKEEAPEEEVSAPQRASALKKPFPTKTLVTAIAVIVIVIGGYLVYRLFENVVLRGEVHIAVLPLQGTTEEESAIGAGFAEEIVEKLQSVEAVTVMGYPSSIFVSKRYDDPLRELVELQYPYVVRGTIMQSGDSYSLKIQLVDSLGAEVWGQTFQKPLTQFSEVAGEIAQQVVNYFHGEMTSETASEFRRSSTKDGEAYRLYLKAKGLYRHPTKANLQSAVQLLQRVRQRDEGFAEAFALASLIYSAMYDRGYERTDATLTSAEEFTMKATIAGGTLPLVLLAKGRIAMLKGRLNDAQEYFDGVLQKSPVSADALCGKAEILLRTGNYKKALSLLEDAYDLNPRDETILLNLAYAHHLQGTPKEGIVYHRLNLLVVDDSINYLIGPIADAIQYHPDVLLEYKERVAAAFEVALQRQKNDWGVWYRRARHQQFIVSAEASEYLKQTERELRKELATRPRNVEAMLNLALTLTRLGAFNEGNDIVEKVKNINAVSPSVLYKIAEVYSIQNKNEVYEVIKEAVGKDFQLSEICNGDFYNVREHDDFKNAIILPIK